jgi:hypothetical protein
LGLLQGQVILNLHQVFYKYHLRHLSIFSKLPIMMQMEGYEEFKEELRLSIRGGSEAAL